MTLLLWLALGCAPPPEGESVSPVAGCSVLETRYGYWDSGEVPWRVERREWDEEGHLVFRDLTVAPGDPNATQTIQSWQYDHLGRVVVERDQYIESKGGLIPPVRSQQHTWDGDLLLQTDAFNELADGSATPTGTWRYDYDAQGHLNTARWDGNQDTVPDLFIDEVWTHDLLGWRVDRSETFTDGGTVIATESRELDDLERVVRKVEDWDADGVPEKVQVFAFDDLGRTVAWELGGTAMLGTDCTYTWRGDDPAGSRCRDEIREGTFVTTWRYPRPGRADIAQVTQLLEGQGEADTEAWSFEWDCPGG